MHRRPQLAARGLLRVKLVREHRERPAVYATDLLEPQAHRRQHQILPRRQFQLLQHRIRHPHFHHRQVRQPPRVHRRRRRRVVKPHHHVRRPPQHLADHLRHRYIPHMIPRDIYRRINRSQLHRHPARHRPAHRLANLRPRILRRPLVRATQKKLARPPGAVRIFPVLEPRADFPKLLKDQPLKIPPRAAKLIPDRLPAPASRAEHPRHLAAKINAPARVPAFPGRPPAPHDHLAPVRKLRRRVHRPGRAHCQPIRPHVHHPPAHLLRQPPIRQAPFPAQVFQRPGHLRIPQVFNLALQPR